MDSEFLNKTPQANNISQKTDLFDYLKINNFFCYSKTTKTKLTEDQMRRYLQSLNVTMSKYLYYKINFHKSMATETQHLQQKTGKDMNKQFTEEAICTRDAQNY